MSQPISNHNSPKAKPPIKRFSRTQAKPGRDGFISLEDTVGGSWKDQLAVLKPGLVAREELGIASALDSKEGGEIIARVLADETPTEDLKVIADRHMADNGMLPEFTGQVNKAAAAITEPPKPDHECVVDLRHLKMCSVDNGILNPETGELEDASKDIDQVEYGERLPNGNIRMYVGIADVDAAIKKGDVNDNHAMHQGATVYTDDKIYPMIHRNLSENHTSLNGGEDRLATIKEYEVTPDGQIIKPKIYRAYVHNHAQMAYDSVNEFLTDGDGPKPPQLSADPDLAEQMKIQDEAAQRIRHHFHAKGSLDIESSEGRATMEDGEVIGMVRQQQTRAKDKVKFNMMAANITTMRVLEDAGLPTLRRVVKTPENWDRIQDLAKKYNWKLPPDPSAKALNEFLEARKEANPGAHEELCAQVVRLVGRGEYVVAVPGEIIEGHFNLQALEYGHTTAPNRRAPDLVNQRIEKAYAEGKECPYTLEELEELAMHFNGQEQVIKTVERKVHRSAEAKLMKDKIGKSYDGRIHKEIPNGTLVRLDEPYVTGMVKKKIEGETGEEVRVTVDGVNVEKGHIDFSVASEQMHDGFVLKT